MSDKRRALGRGLGALIPSAPAPGGRPSDVFFDDTYSHRRGAAFGLTDIAPEGHDEASTATKPPPTAASAEHGAVDVQELGEVEGARFAHLPVDAIRANSRQPRSVFDEEELAELAESIRAVGVLQPVVVREAAADSLESGGPTYELVMGERRWRASQQAGLRVVPAIIRETQDDALLRDALLENLHRSQLNPLEEGAAYQQLLEDFGGTHDELASRLGRSRPQISNTIRLLQLPPLVARRVAAGVLSAGHARALLGLADAAAMERLAQRIVAEGLSVRSVEEIVAMGDGDRVSARRAPREVVQAPHLDELAASLSDRFDTRVTIAMGRRKGRLSVEFASVEDLDRILSLLEPSALPTTAPPRISE